MSDLALLHAHLRLARGAGMPFGEVWPIALDSLERNLPPGEASDWFLALNATQYAWERAYEQRGRIVALSADLAQHDTQPTHIAPKET